MPKGQFIGIDFDGTCVEHDYPNIGQDVPGCVEVLRKLTEAGHSLILYTMRDGKELQDAESWFAERGISLFAVNKNPAWSTTSPKVWCHLYIDDAALGIPLIEYELGQFRSSGEKSKDLKVIEASVVRTQVAGFIISEGLYLKALKRPYVNWKKVDELLTEKGYYL